MNWRIAVFVGAVALAMPVVFCIAPFLQTMRTVAATQLRGTARSMTQGRRERRMLAVAVVMQFSLAFVLVTTAGLLLRSFVHANRTDPG